MKSTRLHWKRLFILGCRYMQTLHSMVNFATPFCMEMFRLLIEQPGGSSWLSIYFGNLEAFFFLCTVSSSIHHLLVPSIAST